MRLIWKALEADIIIVVVNPPSWVTGIGCHYCQKKKTKEIAATHPSPALSFFFLLSQATGTGGGEVSCTRPFVVYDDDDGCY